MIAKSGRRRKGARRFLAAAIAAAVCLCSFSTGTLGVSAETADGTDGLNASYRTILGKAVNFGIVTENFDLSEGDAQTNVAAIVGKCVNQTGNDLTNKEEQTFILAQVDQVFKIKGQGAGAYVRTTAKDQDKVVGLGSERIILDTTQTREQLTAEVQAMLDHGSEQSALLASQTATAVLEPDRNDHAKYMVDLTKYDGAGTYYVTLDDEGFRKIQEADKLRIYKRDDQTVVFNVVTTKTKDLTIYKYKVNGIDTDRFTDGKYQGSQNAAQTVVWNFAALKDGASGTQLETITTQTPVVGILLAPRSEVIMDGTSAGWIIAQKVKIRAGEYHNINQEIQALRPTSAVLTAGKQVDGKTPSVSGFQFSLEEVKSDGTKTTLSASTTEENKGQAVFPEIQYDEKAFTPDEAGGTVQTHLYKITEPGGTTTLNGVVYKNDSRVYYARVMVTKLETRNPAGTAYVASAPAYFEDESCKTAVEPDQVIFRNVTKQEEKPAGPKEDEQTKDDTGKNNGGTEDKPSTPENKPSNSTDTPSTPEDKPSTSTDKPSTSTDTPSGTTVKKSTTVQKTTTEKTETGQKTQTVQKTETPKTGDTSHVGLYAGLAVLAAAGIVLCLKRRGSSR